MQTPTPPFHALGELSSYLHSRVTIEMYWTLQAAARSPPPPESYSDKVSFNPGISQASSLKNRLIYSLFMLQSSALTPLKEQEAVWIACFPPLWIIPEIFFPFFSPPPCGWTPPIKREKKKNVGGWLFYYRRDSRVPLKNGWHSPLESSSNEIHASLP